MVSWPCQNGAKYTIGGKKVLAVAPRPSGFAGVVKKIKLRRARGAREPSDSEGNFIFLAIKQPDEPPKEPNRTTKNGSKKHHLIPKRPKSTPLDPKKASKNTLNLK